MKTLKMAAFSDGDEGGNPAGVILCDELPATASMQSTAKEIGYSETVFATKIDEADSWRVRYFSPETEVPFCGHATIALGASLAEDQGAGVFNLQLNNSSITVEGSRSGELFHAALQSPPTTSRALNSLETAALLDLFSYSENQLEKRIPPAHIHAGADHYVLAVQSRDDLKAMTYDLQIGREFMKNHDLVTIMLVYIENNQMFHVRNAFASGGVFEDPATGAAAAAFSGYLRDIAWPHLGSINIVQGEDMKMRSKITAEIDDLSGSSIRISGTVRVL